MALTEAEFISISEKVVKDIAKTCSSIPELSTSPLLDLALDIEEEIYCRAQSKSNPNEVWEDDSALDMYHTMCTLMIENISTDNVYSRRLCSARPSHVVDKFCSKKALTRRNSTKKIQSKVGSANAQRLLASKNQPCEPKRSAGDAAFWKGKNKSPTSVADIFNPQPLKVPNATIIYTPPTEGKNAMLPPPSKPIRLKIVHSRDTLSSPDRPLKRVRLSSPKVV